MIILFMYFGSHGTCKIKLAYNLASANSSGEGGIKALANTDPKNAIFSAPLST